MQNSRSRYRESKSGCFNVRGSCRPPAPPEWSADQKTPTKISLSRLIRGCENLARCSERAIDYFSAASAFMIGSKMSLSATAGPVKIGDVDTQ